MKINNISINRKEAENMIQALNYKLRNNGTIEMEIETRYLAGCRNVHAIVHVEHGWSKEFNLTSGAVTNITEDTDGDHDSDSILTRLENIVHQTVAINQYCAKLNQLYDKYEKVMRDIEAIAGRILP